MTFINNRPDMEAPMQQASETVYKDMPRPIVAFCASGTRSAALWAFAHVEKMGVDGVMDGVSAAGYNLEQIRGALEVHSVSKT